MKIITYGTLKKGFYNYNRFMGNAKFLGNVHITGYKMYSNGTYPAIVKSDVPSDLISGELYEIEDDNFNIIRDVELRAGYYMDTYKMRGEDIPLFVMDKSQVDNEKWQLVEDGIFK